MRPQRLPPQIDRLLGHQRAESQLYLTHDNVGNVENITEDGSTTHFVYEHDDRLTDASNGYTGLYRHDTLGNLESKVDGGTSRSLSYNLATRPKHAPKTAIASRKPTTLTATWSTTTRECSATTPKTA